MDKPSVLVVGGGIAGLSAAYYLDKFAKESHGSLSVTVIEADRRWGGKIQTLKSDGFVVEAGPDAFLVSKPWALELCRELGIAGRLQPTNPDRQKTYIAHRGQLVQMPGALTMMIPTDLQELIRTPLLSLRGKVRMVFDFFLPVHPPRNEESLRGFLTRRLGREVYENILGPLTSGIYAGDGAKLSVQATFPYLLDLEARYGSLLRGAKRLRRERAQQADMSLLGTRSAFLAPVGGMETMVEALLGRLKASGVELHAGKTARRIERRNDRFLVEVDQGASLQTDLIILAVPAYASVNIVRDLSADLAAELAEIEYAPSTTVSLAYRKQDIPHPLDGYGYLIPRSEGRPALACTWTSTKFSQRAPEDHVLLRVFFGSANQLSASGGDDQMWIDLAQQELRRTLGVSEAPIIRWVLGWSKAMPQYHLGHLDRLRRIDKILKDIPGLLLAGNAYRGVGIPDTVHLSKRVAESLNPFIDRTGTQDAQPERVPIYGN